MKADILSESELKRIRKTTWVGEEIVYYEVTDSTNVQAKRLAEEGGVHGTLVVANRQNAGRGRSGRTWESPENGGIFMTLLLRPQIKPQEASMLTLVTAIAVAKAIQLELDLPAKIKWPNDIVINGKKVCGILTEMQAQIDAISYVVVGIGINVFNQSFPKELEDIATSLTLESDNKISRAKLIETVWEQFEIYYDKFLQTKDLSLMKEEYESYLVNRDREVYILDPKEPYQGIAKGITNTGELLVEADDDMKCVFSGEVSVRGIYGYV